MKQSTKGFSLVGLIIVIAFIAGILFLLQKSFIGPKRVCPDEWVIKRGTTANKNDTEQYLVLNGKRVELEDYDLNWIREECSVNKPEGEY